MVGDDPVIGRDNRTGPLPSLDDVDLGRLIRSLEAGYSARVLAEAFGLSPRTVYRYRGARLVVVDVEGWPIPFLVRPGERPIPVSMRKRRTK